MLSLSQVYFIHETASSGFQPDIVLNPDDVAAAIVLFGEGTGTVIPLGDSSSSADDQGIYIQCKCHVTTKYGNVLVT